MPEQHRADKKLHLCYMSYSATRLTMNQEDCSPEKKNADSTKKADKPILEALDTIEKGKVTTETITKVIDAFI